MNTAERQRAFHAANPHVAEHLRKLVADWPPIDGPAVAIMREGARRLLARREAVGASSAPPGPGTPDRPAGGHTGADAATSSPESITPESAPIT